MMTVSEIAEEHGVSRQSIHAYRRRGTFPQPVTDEGSTRPRFRADEVAAFFAANPRRPGKRTDRSDPEATPALEGAVVEPVYKITSVDDVWRPGDWVLDAAGNVRVRSEHPQWVWGYPNEGVTRTHDGLPYAPEGSLEEGEVVRPLILLVRNGEVVGGRAVEELEG